jgi:hypothetical protein
MSIQRLLAQDFSTLENAGVRSPQIVWPGNALEALVAITQATISA